MSKDNSHSPTREGDIDFNECVQKLGAISVRHDADQAKIKALVEALKLAQWTLYNMPAVDHPDDLFINRRQAANERIEAALKP